MRCDAFRIDQGFIRRHIEMQVLLMNTAEGAQVSTERRTCPFTSIAVDLALAITIIIPRPLVHAVADGRMAPMTAAIALPLIGIKPRAARCNIFGNQRLTGPRIRVVTHPEALLTRLPRDHTDDRGAIVGIGAMPFPFIGAPTGWIGGIQMRGAFFPRRSGTVHPPQRRCQPSSLWGPSHSDWAERVAAAYGAVSVKGLTHVPGARSA